ncbi:hypothetical protein EPUS_00751 [Endocarpon pusillum Z07020]|uniref:HMG box domain-containing protein n=1 Tax=Endocarpon pusillum (strain Z07020 / HMAS-L-300199) TaxID=1263415 RepID=U1GRM9_ENDPU|nr:uncharacterized protein EPUS_00751 [Endocarpon pusillum Z07020]ERF74621.1 hypothetical protein EPUS_00751 [Endocarpon pusillum Z07020]
MKFFVSPRRVLSHQSVTRLSHLRATRLSCAHSWSRVTFNNNLGYLSSLLQCNASTSTLGQLLSRSYATKPGKPKAHTGRPAASKRKPAAAQRDAAAGVPDKAPSKKTATRKKPAAKKPARKTKRKRSTKSKPEGKRKRLTDKQKAAKEKKDAGKKKKDLRKIALLDPPKRLPSTAFIVLSTETSSKGMSLSQHSKEVSAQYKNLSPEEMERLNHVANENKAKNEAAFKKWLGEHSPVEIKAANAARSQLKRQAKKEGSKKIYPHIQDERIVKQARTSYTYFLKERFASGDMKNMKIGEVGALIGREWRALSAEEKKPYEDRAARDKARYIEEYTTVYGTAPQFQKRAKDTA